MIALVHGPRGCGKSTALRAWLARRGWMSPRGYRTFFDVASSTLRLVSWDGRIDTPIAYPLPARDGQKKNGVPWPMCPVRPFDPACAPALHAFLDGAFLSSDPVPARLLVQTPVPAPLSAVPPPSLPWELESRAFWEAALASIEGIPSRPLAVDELGILEILPGALDPDSLQDLLSAIQAASRAILVVQERALPFWLPRLSTAAGRTDSGLTGDGKWL